jgi:hypothetical protein
VWSLSGLNYSYNGECFLRFADNFALGSVINKPDIIIFRVVSSDWQHQQRNPSAVVEKKRKTPFMEKAFFLHLQ